MMMLGTGPRRQKSSRKFFSVGQLINNNNNYKQVQKQQPHTQLKASAVSLTNMAPSITSSTVPIRMQVVLVISSICILAGYHMNLFWKENRGGKKTWRQYQADIREDWSKH